MEAIRLAAISLFFLAAFGFLAGALVGGRAKKVSIGGIDMSPFKSAEARMGALVAGLVLLVIALLLAIVAPPQSPTVGPSGQTPTSPSASPTPKATPGTTVAPSPSLAGTAAPTGTAPAATSSPAPGQPDVAGWALTKRDELEVLGVSLGKPTGNTLAAAEEWFVQGFEHGAVYRSPNGTVIALHGLIYDRWRLIGSATKPAPNLGYPSRDQQIDARQNRWQRFADGAVQCTSVRCYLVFGQVYTAWRAHESELGYPTADVQVDFLARLGTFERGTVAIDQGGRLTICGKDGSTIVGGPISCGSGPQVAP